MYLRVPGRQAQPSEVSCPAVVLQLGNILCFPHGRCSLTTSPLQLETSPGSARRGPRTVGPAPLLRVHLPGRELRPQPRLSHVRKVSASPCPVSSKQKHLAPDVPELKSQIAQQHPIARAPQVCRRKVGSKPPCFPWVAFNAALFLQMDGAYQIGHTEACSVPSSQWNTANTACHSPSPCRHDGRTEGEHC